MLKEIFIVNFNGPSKKRGDFFWYQFMIIFSIFFLLLTIFAIDFFINTLGFNTCLAGKYCFDEELILGQRIEIAKHILFIMILMFIFRFDTANIMRFSSFKFSKFFEKLMIFVFTVLRIYILFILLFFILNFYLFFKGQNFYFSNDILYQAKNLVGFFPALYIIFALEFYLFIIGFISPNPKYNTQVYIDEMLEIEEIGEKIEKLK